MPTVKRTNEEWRALLMEQRASGQTQEEWCAANGVNLYTLRDRASRLRKRDGQGESVTAPVATIETAQRPKQPEAVSAVWMEVTPEKPPAQAAGISIWCGGFAVTVKSSFDAELLTEVLRAVSRACC